MKRKATHTRKDSTDRDDRDYLNALMTEREAAVFLGLSTRFLQNRRLRGGGPDPVAISRRCVRYRRRELIAWSNAHLQARASEADAPSEPASETTKTKRPNTSRRRPTAERP
jgi:hypothetical protein